MHVHNLQLTDDELRVLQSAVHSWVNTFTHDEPELLRRGKDMRARIDAELEHTLAGPAAGGRRITPL